MSYEEYEFKIDIINAYGEAKHRPLIMPSKKLYAGTEPSSIRHRILIDTLFYCATHDMKALDVIAGKNVKRKNSPNEYIVMNNDWGVSLSYLTKKHGYTFAVINMANAVVFGGGYLGGASAQEENMFRRTNCFFFMDYDGEPILKDGKYYTEKMKHLIDAKDNRGNILDNGRVYLDMRPRLYLFGEETKEPGLGYRQLDEILPFYELRSAAINLSRKPSNYVRDTKSRIRAQFNTLIEKGCEHVILSAFGCGAFGNDPKDISTFYSDVLQERHSTIGIIYKDLFKVICFSIIPNPGQPENNFEVFRDGLDGFVERVPEPRTPSPSGSSPSGSSPGASSSSASSSSASSSSASSPGASSPGASPFHLPPPITRPITSLRASPRARSPLRASLRARSPLRASLRARSPPRASLRARSPLRASPRARSPPRASRRASRRHSPKASRIKASSPKTRRKPSNNLNNFLNIAHKPLQYGYNTGKQGIKHVVGNRINPLFHLVEAPYMYGARPLYQHGIKPAYNYKWFDEDVSPKKNYKHI